MLIKLQPDQISLFWDLIREGMIKSFRIPDRFSQDFSINALKQLLTGETQCWLGHEVKDDNTKEINYILTTQIVDEKYYGLRAMYITSIHSLKPITADVLTEIHSALENYALVNNCNVVMADYYSERVKGFLLDTGFEKFKSTCRLFLGGN